jgi:hypothetical protein
MADSSIPTPSGANVDTRTQTGGDHREVIVVGDATAANTQTVGTGGDAVVSISNPNSILAGMYATLSPEGAQNVSLPGTTLFSDTFEGGMLDTIIKWTPTGGVAPVTAQGVLSLPPGQVTNAASGVFSKPSFNFNASTLVGASISFEAGTTSLGNHRFFGFGTGISNQVSNPLYDAIGFEITTAGSLQACVYSAGSLVFSSPLTMSTDGVAHRYVVITRGDVTWWYKDTFDIPAAFSYTAPSSQRLPLRLHNINGTISNGVTPVMTSTGVAAYDNVRNSTTISDGTNPWVKGTVKDSGQKALSSDTSLVVTLSPNGSLPGIKPNEGELIVQDVFSKKILMELKRVSRALQELTGVPIPDDEVESI